MGKLRQQCGECRAAFQVDGAHLGKLARCPKCGAKMRIVDSGGAASSVSTAGSTVRAKPAPARSAPPRSATAELPKAKPLPAAAKPAPARPAAVKPAAARPDAAGPAAGEIGGLGIVVGEPTHSVTQRTKRRKQTAPTPAVILMAAGGVAALLLLLVTVVLLTGGGESAPTADQRGTAADRGGPPRDHQAQRPAPASHDTDEAPSRFGRPGQNLNALVLDLSDRDRSEVSVVLNGESQEIPALGPIMFTLNEGSHVLRLTRPGYEPIEHRFTLGSSGREVYRPFWQRAGAGTVASQPPPTSGGQASFDDWLQDFELAKQRAAANDKDILIAFNGSDWCGWCIRLMHEVFFQPEFRGRIDRDFVLVNIDLPRNPQAAAKVQDMHRNQQLIEQFGINSFPTVMLADARGQVYARGGYVEGGVPSFLRAVEVWKRERSVRDRLFARVASSTGQARIEAARETMQWLGEADVLQHYRPTLSEWLETARRSDPNNARGEYEAFFEMDWYAELASIDRTELRQVRGVLARLKQFQRERDFSDPDRGARMHLIAATFLAMHEEVEEALVHAQAGVDCEPNDGELLAGLRGAVRALARSDVISTGSGFIVGEGGYLLTNHHVIEDGVPYVYLADLDEPVAARVLAQDERNDIALLKLDDPAAAGLKPLPVSATAVRRGSRVAVFGYPLSDAMGGGLKLTTGGVSALPDAANEGMLVLDCRVNPGNSGGPLCDPQGRVIGLITAKSYSGEGLDSYGMAQPGSIVEEFLKQNLPNYRPAPTGDLPSLEWEEVDELVSDSVLLIVMKQK